jgi:hypothetical protein
MSSRSALIRLLALVFAFFLVTGLLYASTTTSNLSWWVIGSGGNRLSSGNVVLQSTLGQPLAYRASNGNLALCAGFWCATGGDYEVFLPLVMNQFLACYPGPSEGVGNNHWTKATGPLCSGLTYAGNIGPGEEDWFYFVKNPGGAVNITAVGLPIKSGLTLFYTWPPIDNDEGRQHVGELPYELTCTAKCSAAGVYLIRIVSGSSANIPYSLRVTFP